MDSGCPIGRAGRPLAEVVEQADQLNAVVIAQHHQLHAVLARQGVRGDEAAERCHVLRVQHGHDGGGSIVRLQARGQFLNRVRAVQLLAEQRNRHLHPGVVIRHNRRENRRVGQTRNLLHFGQVLVRLR